MTASYRFRVAGQLSDDLVESFGPIRWQRDEQGTVFVIAVRDQPELFGVLGRCETLRLTLLEMEVLPTDSG